MIGAVGLTLVIAVHEVAEVVIIANGVRAGRFRTQPDHRARASRVRPTHVAAPA